MMRRIAKWVLVVAFVAFAAGGIYFLWDFARLLERMS